MSAERDELRELVEQLPEEDVPAALADVRRHVRPVGERRWPPAFFGAGRAERSDVAARTEETLGEGFGRPGVIVCDTGPIVAAALQGDNHYHECVELFTGLHLAGHSLLVPGTVVAEVGYMLAREAGARVESLFLMAVADGDFELVDLTTADLRRAAQLVQTYGDMPLGTTDATVIAVAERLGVREVATLDRRHFSVVRPSHVDAFTLLPS